MIMSKDVPSGKLEVYPCPGIVILFIIDKIKSHVHLIGLIGAFYRMINATLKFDGQTEKFSIENVKVVSEAIDELRVNLNDKLR